MVKQQQAKAMNLRASVPEKSKKGIGDGSVG